MKKYQYLASWDDQTLTRVGEPTVVLGDSNVSQVEVIMPANFLLDPTKAEARIYFLLPGEKESDFETLETATKDENGDSHVTWTIKHVHSQKGGRLAFSLTLIGDGAQWDSRTSIIPVYESRYQPESEEAEEPYTGRLTALEGSMASIRGEFAEVQEDFEELKETATLGTPIPESLVANMQEGHVYIYTGTEPGYTAGHVYYYVNGTLTDGGVYGGTAVDATLTQSGQAADAKVTGDKIAEIKEDLSVLDGIGAEVDAVRRTAEQLPIGLPEAQKTLIISIMRNALYSTDMSADIDALENAFFADIPATAVILNKESVALEGTESQVALVATPVPLNTTDVIVWASSNPTIATVDSNGLVTAVGTGTCTITATAGTVSVTCSVTVVMVSIVSIDAVYNQGGIVYTTDSLDSLKDDLVITAHWSNGTTSTVDSYDYTLSGTLTAGSSTITATYAGCTDTFTVTVTQKDLDSIAYENKSYRDIFMTGNMLTGADFENGMPAGWNTSSGSPEVTNEAYVSASNSLKLFMTSSSGSQTGASATDIGWTTESGKVYYDAAKLNCVRFNGGIRFGFFTVNKADYLSVTAATDGWITLDKYYTASGVNPPFGSRVFLGATGTPGSNPSDMDGYVDDIVHVCLTDLFESVPNKSVMNRLYEEYCTLRNGGAV